MSGPRWCRWSSLPAPVYRRPRLRRCPPPWVASGGHSLKAAVVTEVSDTEKWVYRERGVETYNSTVAHGQHIPTPCTTLPTNKKIFYAVSQLHPQDIYMWFRHDVIPGTAPGAVNVYLQAYNWCRLKQRIPRAYHHGAQLFAREIFDESRRHYTVGWLCVSMHAIGHACEFRVTKDDRTDGVLSSCSSN